MNNLILLKGRLVSRHNQASGGLSYRKMISVKADSVEVLWHQLQAVRDAFAV